VHRLVYFATFRNVGDDIARETEIKKWRREKKVTLIEERNRTWEDLAEGWGEVAVIGCLGRRLRFPRLRPRFHRDWRPVWNDEVGTEFLYRRGQQIPPSFASLRRRNDKALSGFRVRSRACLGRDLL
jgi:hypothetical protein